MRGKTGTNWMKICNESKKYDNDHKWETQSLVLRNEAKAFGRVDQEYVFRTLEHLWIWDYFLEIVTLIYKSITSQTIINKALTTKNFE